MNRKQKVLLLACLLVTLVSLWGWRHAASTPISSPPVTQGIPPTPFFPTVTPWVDPHDAQVATFAPVHFEMDAIQVNADVLAVGTTPDGHMDAPHCPTPHIPLCYEVYWWDGGGLPGFTGNMVFAAHVNLPDASPSVFGALTKAQIGDLALVTDHQGIVSQYRVVGLTTVSAYGEGPEDPVINALFSPTDTAVLHLLTCYGQWDGHTFNHRYVVTLQLVGAPRS